LTAPNPNCLCDTSDNQVKMCECQHENDGNGRLLGRGRRKMSGRSSGSRAGLAGSDFLTREGRVSEFMGAHCASSARDAYRAPFEFRNGTPLGGIHRDRMALIFWDLTP
jgi:hypothetical protein